MAVKIGAAPTVSSRTIPDLAASPPAGLADAFLRQGDKRGALSISAVANRLDGVGQKKPRVMRGRTGKTGGGTEFVPSSNANSRWRRKVRAGQLLPRVLARCG